MKKLSEITLEEKNILVAQMFGWRGPFQKEWLHEYGKEGEDVWALCGTSPESKEREPLPSLEHFFIKSVIGDKCHSYFDEHLINTGLVEK